MRRYEPICSRNDIPGFEGIVEVLRRFGIFALGGADGCECTDFKFRGVEVHIACRKSEGGHLPKGLGPEGFRGYMVRLDCRYMFATLRDVLPCAAEIVFQLQEDRPDLPIFVRLCSYTNDHDKEKPHGSCLYCGKERDNIGDYLCSECLHGDDCWGEKISRHYSLPPEWSGYFPALEPRQ